MAEINEDPFDLIQKGNAFISSSSHWSAADAFSRASLALRRRADSSAKQSANAEHHKIASLYRSQSLEYFYKARYSLLAALTFENEQDQLNTRYVAKVGSGALDPTCSFIGDEEGGRRRRIFERLFVLGDVGSDSSGGYVKDEKTENEVSENEINVEMDIPRAPSSSLPSNTTTSNNDISNDSQQRIDDIRSALQRLGMSLPDDESKHNSNQNISSKDQVKLIIQQATDEIRVERRTDNDEVQNNDSEVNENDSMFEGYNDQFEDEESDDDLDALLTKVEKLVTSIDGEIKEPHDRLLGDQLVVIRNAQALLLEARLCLELDRERGICGLDAGPSSGCEDDPGKANAAKNENLLLLDKRRKAQERIDDAVRCLQDGLAKWT